jgi:hypothetical protein
LAAAREFACNPPTPLTDFSLIGRSQLPAIDNFHHG